MEFTLGFLFRTEFIAAQSQRCKLVGNSDFVDHRPEWDEGIGLSVKTFAGPYSMQNPELPRAWRHISLGKKKNEHWIAARTRVCDCWKLCILLKSAHPELAFGVNVDLWPTLHLDWGMGFCGEAGERLLSPRCRVRKCAQMGSWKSTVGSPNVQTDWTPNAPFGNPTEVRLHQEQLVSKMKLACVLV